MANNYPNKQKYRLDLNRPLSWQEGDENERYPTQWETGREYKEGQVVLHDDSYTVGSTAYGALSFFQCTLSNTGNQPGLPNGVTTNPPNQYWVRVGSVDATGVGPQGPQGIQGIQGQQGPAGSAGTAGDQGIQGIQGVPGPGSTVPGPPGSIGPAGPQGPAGAPGPGSTVPGPAGTAGTAGTAGSTGPRGKDGAQSARFECVGADPSGADPGSGKFSIDTTTQLSTTKIYISKTDNSGQSIPLWLQPLTTALSVNASCAIQLFNLDSTNDIAMYVANTVIDNGTYFEIQVANLVHNNLYVTADNYTIAYAIAGPQGVQGTQGVQGQQGIQGIQGIQGETGETGPANPVGSMESLKCVAASFNNDIVASASGVLETDNVLINDPAFIAVQGGSNNRIIEWILEGGFTYYIGYTIELEELNSGDNSLNSYISLKLDTGAGSPVFNEVGGRATWVNGPTMTVQDTLSAYTILETPDIAGATSTFRVEINNTSISDSIRVKPNSYIVAFKMAGGIGQTGADGVQGIQGIQGPVGPQGPGGTGSNIAFQMSPIVFSVDPGDYDSQANAAVIRFTEGGDILNPPLFSQGSPVVEQYLQYYANNTVLNNIAFNNLGATITAGCTANIELCGYIGLSGTASLIVVDSWSIDIGGMDTGDSQVFQTNQMNTTDDKRLFWRIWFEEPDDGIQFSITGNQSVGGPGAQGPAGTAGTDGAQGPQGPIGPIGPIGPDGAKGDQGDQGIQGIQGPQGNPGTAGTAGANFAFYYQSTAPTGSGTNTIPPGSFWYDSVTGVGYFYVYDGNTYQWATPIGPAGQQGPPGQQGPQGADGIQGIQGPPGPAGTAGATAAGNAKEVQVSDGVGGLTASADLTHGPGGLTVTKLTNITGDGTDPGRLRLYCEASSHHTYIEGPSHSGAATYGIKVPPNVGPTGAQLEIRSLDAITGLGDRAQLRWTPTKIPQTLTYVPAGTTHNLQAGFNAEVTVTAATTKLTLAYSSSGIDALQPGDYGTIKVILSGTALSGGATINVWYGTGTIATARAYVINGGAGVITLDKEINMLSYYVDSAGIPFVTYGINYTNS